MADYRDLLRRAIDALPENTGAQRRSVYEKARSALVAQLRAIDPPLPAREITQHRLKLEDCIRQVEQEATDKLLGRFREIEEPVSEPEAAPEPLAPEASAPEPEPAPVMPPAIPPEGEPEPEISAPDVSEPSIFEPQAAEAEPADDRDLEPPSAAPEPEAPIAAPEPVLDDRPEAEISSEDDARSQARAEMAFVPREEAVEPEAPSVGLPQDAVEAPEDEAAPEAEVEFERPEAPIVPPPGPASIEDIISQAARESEQTVEPEPVASREGVVVPLRGPVSPLPGPADAQPEVTVGEAQLAPGAGLPDPEHDYWGRDVAAPAADPQPETVPPAPVADPEPSSQHRSPPPIAAVPIGEAMSAVREVEVQPIEPMRATVDASDPQMTIDRAIAALDREARGESSGPEGEGAADAGADAAPKADSGVPTGSDELNALESGFGEAEADPEEERSGGGSGLTVFLVLALVLLAGGAGGGYWAWREGYIDLDTVFGQADPQQQVADADPVIQTPDPVMPTPGEDVTDGAEGQTAPGNTTTAQTPGETATGEDPLPFTENGPTPDSDIIEDRLPAEDTPPAADPGAEDDTDPPPAELAVAGTQSLLLEEQGAGAAGATPFSGSVEWSRGSDELGQPTIVASASIPARNLDVDVLLRRNADASLPASHLMEVNFTVAESFVGGSIANLPGVLLKNEELVQGTPLTGASARIVGNSFLFALSGTTDQDVASNTALLRDQNWLDLALVYGTGRRAIITLEKGDEGQAIFDDVMDIWAEADAEAAD